MSTSALETELVEASAFEPTKNYERQDYLAALARALNEVDEDVFDELSVDAQDWFNAAVKAINKKQDIPDFPDAEEAEADDSEGEADDNTDDESEDDTADDSETDGDEAEETSKDEDEEAPPPKKTKKPAKAGKPVKVKAKPVVDEDDDDEPEEKAAKKTPKRLPTPGENKNRYGITIGSQGHKAIVMLEEGSRMSAITEDVGGTYYNLLKKLTQDGHKIEKSPTGIIKLIHKDDIKKVKGKK